MPVMPRSNKKATQIAYNILGKPSNLEKSKTRKKSNDVAQRGGYDELDRSTPVRVPRAPRA